MYARRRRRQEGISTIAKSCVRSATPRRRRGTAHRAGGVDSASAARPRGRTAGFRPAAAEAPPREGGIHAGQIGESGTGRPWGCPDYRSGRGWRPAIGQLPVIPGDAPGSTVPPCAASTTIAGRVDSPGLLPGEYRCLTKRATTARSKEAPCRRSARRRAASWCRR
jgi:hypothetical protein